MNNQVPRLTKKIAQVRERLDTSLVASLDTPAQKVLQFLGQEEEKLDQHRERATKLMEYQVCLCSLLSKLQKGYDFAARLLGKTLKIPRQAYVVPSRDV